MAVLAAAAAAAQRVPHVVLGLRDDVGGGAVFSGVDPVPLPHTGSVRRPCRPKLVHDLAMCPLEVVDGVQLDSVV